MSSNRFGRVGACSFAGRRDLGTKDCYWQPLPFIVFSIAGPTDYYIWGRRQLAFHRCSKCGCVIGWLPLSSYAECGINARILDGFWNSGVTIVIERDASV